MAAKSFTASKLIIAIRAGLLSDVISAIEEGADIEEPDMHGFVGLPLRTACFEGSIDIVRELLRRGANVNADAGDGPGAPLRLAKRRGHQSIASLLLLQGAQMHAKTETTPSTTARTTKVNSTPVEVRAAPAPAEAANNKIQFDSPPPNYLSKEIETTVDFFLDTDAPVQEELIASPLETRSISLPEEHPGNIIEFTNPPPAEPIEKTEATFAAILEEPIDNIIELTNPPPELLTEEIEGIACYGTDTNLLTLDLMRLEEEEEAESTKPAPESKKPGFWKNSR